MDGAGARSVSREGKRGGGRGDGLTRKSSGTKTTYRRVERGDVVSDAAGGIKQQRTAEVVSGKDAGGKGGGIKASPDKDQAPVPFHSSLRESLGKKQLQQQPPPPPAKVEAAGVRHVVVERSGRPQSSSSGNARDRSSEPRRNNVAAPGGRRQASPARSAKGSEQPTTQTHTHRVISLSSPNHSPNKNEPKPFKSSLAQSMKNRGSSQGSHSVNGRNGSGMAHAAPDQRGGGSFRRSSSRDSRDGRQRGHSPASSYRSVERDHDSPSIPSTRPSLTRKNSTDSISSQRSDRSERRARSDRRRTGSRSRSRRSSPASNHPRPSTAEASERSGIGPSALNRSVSGGGLRRMSSESAGPPTTLRSSLQASLSTRSSQDVRVQRSEMSGPSGSSSRFDNTRGFRQAQDSFSRRTSLDGSERGLRRIGSLGMRGNSQDARMDDDRKSGGRFQRSSLSSGKMVSSEQSSDQPISTGKESDPEPKSFRSSLSGSIKHDDGPAFGTEVLNVEKAETDRKKLTDNLRERMAARKLEREKSLSKDPPSLKEDRPKFEPRSTAPVTRDLRSGSHPPASTDKEVRTAAYFARIDQENAAKENARRAVPFRSTLKAAIAAPTRPASAVSLTEKIKYSIQELRRLMAFAIPRPADLPDMKITQVIPFRDPSDRPQGSRRFGGGGVSDGGSRRSVGSSARRRDRERPAGRQSQRGGDRGGPARNRDRRGGGGGRGRGGYQPPPPPLFDGPVEPLTVSENRWVPKKAKEGSESVLSHIKSLLNKLTREKFKKLTNELCSVDIASLALLRSVVSSIMDKALEEPNFADVYADLCKEFDTRTGSKLWKFVHTVVDTTNPKPHFWLAMSGERFESYSGPFESVQACLDAAATATSDTTFPSSCEFASLSSVAFHHLQDAIVVVGEQEQGRFYFAKTSISDLTEDELIGGPFPTAEQARQDAMRLTSFKRLLVARCQVEFEKSTSHEQPEPVDDADTDALAVRRREITALRAKRTMLGNMRFLGELYKVGLLKQNVVQGCLFQLMGLELLPGDEVQAQAVRFPDEEDLEALCKMLGTVGKKFDRADNKTIMKIVILRLVELSDDKKLPSRPRFLLKDVLEMRDHMWEPRRKELQQKTLDEVRREAHKLQQQGKNAQHDDLTQRRRKTQISSVQLARENSNLIVARKETEVIEEKDEDSTADEAAARPADPTQLKNRIKSIIQEYISILDLEEAATCVRELPVEPFHAEFAEETINVALNGKAEERERAVDLLTGLYRCGALSANTIQTALVSTTEFLDDMFIDIPLVHQYSAVIFGRLIASGCFGLSWMISDALGHLIDCKLTSRVFPEVLNVLEAESNEQTVVRLLSAEEVNPASVLPRSMRSETRVQEYLQANGIEDFFNGGRGSDDDDDADEIDPEVIGKMRTTIEEYLSVKDFDEVVRCVDELDGVADPWMHFVHTLAMFGLVAKRLVRLDASELLSRLVEAKNVTSEDAEAAMEFVLEDYEDLRIDIPQIATNLCELWAPLFLAGCLSLAWLREAGAHLVAGGHAADILSALFAEVERRKSRDELVAWWSRQEQRGEVWQALATPGEGSSSGNSPGSSSGQAAALLERLEKWRPILQ